MAAGFPTARVLLTGDFQHPEFSAVRAWLREHVAVEAAQEAVLSLAAPVRAYEMIALCQSRPGQFTQAQVESLHKSAPLAGLIAILGSWCEGELRSGRPWHGVERVYWYDAIGRLSASIGRAAGYRTQTPAERIERQIKCLSTAARQTLAVVVARERSEYEALADLCRTWGATPHWQRTPLPTRNVEPALVLLASHDLSDLASPETIAVLRQAWPAARLVTLLNFPRRDEIAALRAAGCDVVLGKPLLFSDLLCCLNEPVSVSSTRALPAP